MDSTTERPEQAAGAAPGTLENSDIYRSYLRSPYLSIKHTSYFQVYADLLEPYRGTAFTFVEIGVLNGGSLFMWRDYFGPRARIIGVDLNPIARRWESEGFEIHIGSQSDPAFWQEFFTRTGDVDVILDDGGHTNEQQIVTACHAIPHLRDGGMLIVEDAHTSYFKHFGNPSKHSFIEWAKRQADTVNSRFPGVSVANPMFRDSVYSVAFYESIVAFRIDRRRCFEPTSTSNGGQTMQAEDFRQAGTAAGEMHGAARRLGQRLPWLRRLKLLRTIKNALLRNADWLQARRVQAGLKKYF